MSVTVERSVMLVPVVTSDDDGVQAVESACLALRAVSNYAALTGTSKTAPVRDVVVDLVADLMHLCAQSGISFEAVSEEAGLVVENECVHDSLGVPALAI